MFYELKTSIGQVAVFISGSALTKRAFAVRYFFYFLFLLLILPSLARAEDISNVTVSSVTDGDTFKINLSCAFPSLCVALPVRVQGVDTPEFHTKDTCEKKKAKTAKLFTREFLKRGTVNLRYCKRDKYFRLLCDVYVVDPQTKAENALSAALISVGLGVAYGGGKKHKYNWCGEHPVLIQRK